MRSVKVEPHANAVVKVPAKVQLLHHTAMLSQINANVPGTLTLVALLLCAKAANAVCIS